MAVGDPGRKGGEKRRTGEGVMPVAAGNNT